MVSSRGQSHLVGVVLMLGVTVLTISGMLLVASPMLDEIQASVGTEAATGVASQFQRSATMVAGGGADARRLDTAGTPVRVDPTRGWLRIDAGGTTLVNETLGTVQFSRDAPRLVAQGGAILYVTEEGTVLKAGPFIDYREGTLDVTLLAFRGNASSTQGVRISAGHTTQVFPDSSAGLTNPVETTSFTITVQSSYYRAWGDYLAEQTGATPTYDSTNQTASVTVVPDYPSGPVETGVLAGTPTGTLELTGGVSVDSYNSSLGPYTGGSDAGRVLADGDVVLTGGGELDGGLLTSGNVTVKGGSDLSGPVTAGGDFTLTGGGKTTGDVHVTGDATVEYGTTFGGNLTYGGTLTDPGNTVSNATQGTVVVDVPPVAPVTAHIDHTVALARDSNDNASIAGLAGGTLDCTTMPDHECEVGSGRYYLDSLALGSDETLVLDTTEGDITLVVDGDVDLTGAATVQTIGDGRVNVYVTGDYRQLGGATVTTPGDHADRFWLYLTPGATADLDGGGRFVGVIYGPGGGGPGAHIEPSVPIYGALVGDIEFVGGGTDIHYDAALATADPVQAPPGTAPVAFLHARVVTVNVTNTA